jgi:hypothetical protein
MGHYNGALYFCISMQLSNSMYLCLQNCAILQCCYQKCIYPENKMNAMKSARFSCSVYITVVFKYKWKIVPLPKVVLCLKQRSCFQHNQRDKYTIHMHYKHYKVSSWWRQYTFLCVVRHKTSQKKK